MEEDKKNKLLKEWLDLTNFQANEACFYLDHGFYPDGRDIENLRVNRRLKTVNKIFAKNNITPDEEYLNSPELIKYCEGPDEE